MEKHFFFVKFSYFCLFQSFSNRLVGFFNLNFAFWYIFWMSNIFKLICWLRWSLIFVLCTWLIPNNLSFILNGRASFIFKYFSFKVFKSQFNIKIKFSRLINLSSIYFIRWNKALDFHQRNNHISLYSI